MGKNLNSNFNFFNMIDYAKANLLPILLALAGVLDQTTDLFVELFTELNAPSWVLKLFRILVICFGAFKLYYAVPNVSNLDTGGSNIPPNKDEK